MRHRKPPPRVYRPDEEPEKEYVEVGNAGRVCSYCGNRGHKQVECPNRPLSDWSK